MNRKKYEITLALLKRIAGTSAVSVEEYDLLSHAKDKSLHTAVKPDIVVWPKDTKEVSKILRVANKNKIPVTAWGNGTSLEGNPIPVQGGIVLDMTRMNKIIKVYPQDLQIIVQPGITSDELNDVLRKKYDLFFPSVSGSSSTATIGGMIANNASGMYALKYGAVGDSVLALEVVLATGEVISTGSRAGKSVSGYDLTSLFVGSEGTLGIITQVTIKLVPLPDATLSIMTSFKNVADALQMAHSLLLLDNKPVAIEFIDASYMILVNQAKNVNLPEKPTLIIEFRGDKSILSNQLVRAKMLSRKYRALAYTEFKTGKQLARVFDYRQSVKPMIGKLLPHSGVLTFESGLPLSRITTYLEKVDALSQNYGLQTIVFGHLGDGTLHGWIVYEYKNIQSQKAAIRLKASCVKYAIKLGGTASSEYGVGIGKRELLAHEHGSSVPVMKKIKSLLDPNSILNPGKLFV